MRPLLLALAFPLALSAQQPDPLLAKIRDEGLNHSHAWSMVDTLATVIGPRLTASPAFMRAATWAKDHLSSWGLADVHMESWPFGRGWELEKFALELTAPRFAPMIGYPDAWSAPTHGDVVGTPMLIAGISSDSLAKMKSSLKGAIVMTQPMVTNFIREDRVDPFSPSADVFTPIPPFGAGGGRGGAGPSEAQKIQAILHDAEVGAVLKTSRGEHGTIFVQTRDIGANAVPSVVVSGENYNNVIRLLQNHVPVKVRVAIDARYFTADTSGYNIIAELPGSDPAAKDEVVMIGAHLDSWNSATGATDNADGAATVLEAMRILKTVGAKPRRTIRVALWGGEEEGLFGSRAWVAQHLAGDANKAARDKFDVYFNIDPGYGRVYGFYSQGNEAAKTIFDQWLEPFKDAGAKRNLHAGIGNTDHLSFTAVGVPGFNPVQEFATYDVRIHHTNMDTMERMTAEEVAQAATVFATFAYNAATRDAPIPRFPR